MKGDELIDLGFDTQECIVVMVAANANATQNGEGEIFGEGVMEEVIGRAKEREREREEKVMKEEAEWKMAKGEGEMKSVPSSQQIK